MTASENIDQNQKITKPVLYVAGGILLVMLVLAAIWAFSPKYEVLFGELDDGDAANIVAELDKSKVAYRLDKNGSQILVPHEDVLRTRLNLMNSGIALKGIVGFEIFDNTDYGMTEFAQKINYQRALQGELARTIMALREVKYARVHLVLAESGLLRSEKRLPSASVTLMMREGMGVKPEQITGIQRLVAAAVPALASENVTVTDHSGVSLTPESEGANSETVGASRRLQKKIEVERYLQEKINAVLDRAVGKNRYVASVDVSINLTQKKTIREDIIVSDDGADPISRRREAKTTTGSKSDTKGDSVTTEVEYLHGKQMDEILVAPGQIERISVGIFVKEKLSLDRMIQIRELTGAAIGLNDRRGDFIKVFADEVTDVAGILNPTPEKVLPTISAEEGKSGSAVAAREPKKKSEPELSDGELISIVAGIALLVFGALMFMFMQRKRDGAHVPRPLTPEERERVLKNLQQWVVQESAPARRSKL